MQAACTALRRRRRRAEIPCSGFLFCRICFGDSKLTGTLRTWSQSRELQLEAGAGSFVCPAVSAAAPPGMKISNAGSAHKTRPKFRSLLLQILGLMLHENYPSVQGQMRHLTQKMQVGESLAAHLDGAPASTCGGFSYCAPLVRSRIRFGRSLGASWQPGQKGVIDSGSSSGADGLFPPPCLRSRKHPRL